MAQSVYEPAAGIAEKIVRECMPYKPVCDHVMIDIETMSLHKHKALILSVGMIEFDPRDDKELHLGEQDILILDPTPQLLLRRRVDQGTQKFWADEAKKDPRSAMHWATPNQPYTELATAFATIRRFCAGRAGVWANGTQFDLSNLDGLAEDCGETKELWHYQAPRDMRTFMKTTKSTRIIPIGDALDIVGAPHDPVHDCISQAYRVWGNWNG